MKTKFTLAAALLLSAGPACAQLSTPDSGQLADYNLWFGGDLGLNVASDLSYYTNPAPPTGLPAPWPYNAGAVQWTGWVDNFATPLAGSSQPAVPLGPTPYKNFSGKVETAEIVFLGETAGWWDGFGYSLNGIDTVLSQGAQAAGSSPNRFFGDNAIITLHPGDTLDFWVTGTGIVGPNPGTTIGATGGKYYLYDLTKSVPAGTNQSFYGFARSRTSTRDPKLVPSEPWTVASFEEVRFDAAADDHDYNDFIFAFNIGTDFQHGSVPEPATCGLLGAVVLAALAGCRRCGR